MKYIAILLLFVCITYTQAATNRSAEEIKEYAEFLRNSVNGKPQAPVTPELEELQPAWERSGKFEGDIILHENQINSLVEVYAGMRNAITNQSLLWPNKVIVYNIDRTNFTSAHVTAIEDAIADLACVSCLTFKVRTPSDINYINVVAGLGCSSQVGRIGGAQILNLQLSAPGSGCFRHGTIVHEFLHAAGFYHMQSTYDRDDYVQIVWENIIPLMKYNFEKYTSSEVTNFGAAYDYGSVLHYSEYGFSINGNKTIIPLKPTSAVI